MMSRSFDAGNSSMPASANIISGNTSVCSTRRTMAERSCSVPGSAAACDANAITPPSTPRSATSSRASPPMTSRITQRNRVTPSTATAPSAATLLVPATRIVATRAATIPSRARVNWAA